MSPRAALRLLAGAGVLAVVVWRVGAGPFVVTAIRGEAWVPSWKGNAVWRLRP